MDSPHPLQQHRVSQGVGRREAVPPSIVACLRHAEHAGHGGDREDGLVRVHEPEDPDGTAPVSRANQAAARERMSRYTRSCLFSRRSRANSSRSAVLRPSPFSSPAVLLPVGLDDPVADRLGSGLELARQISRVAASADQINDFRFLPTLDESLHNPGRKPPARAGFVG